MSEKLISLMIDEKLHKNLQSYCFKKDIKIKRFIADSIWEKLYGKKFVKSNRRESIKSTIE